MVVKENVCVESLCVVHVQIQFEAFLADLDKTCKKFIVKFGFGK